MGKFILRRLWTPDLRFHSRLNPHSFPLRGEWNDGLTLNQNTMKTKLTLKPVNGGPFNCRPGHEIELEDERILCNDIRLPFDTSNYRNIRLWVIGNEFGALCAVWAGHEQDALDEACNAGMLAGLAIDESPDEEDEEVTRLGNAGEPHDLTNAWMQTVRLNGPEDWELIARFAEARGACADTLDK